MGKPKTPRPVRTLATRLAKVREHTFVGRRAELDLFRRLLASPAGGVLFVHGPGGIGKSSLLQRCADVAHEARRPVLALDARDVAPSPRGLLDALAEAMGLSPGVDPLAALAERGRVVLLLDTAEHLEGAEAWIARVLLPSLADGSVALVAGRTAPPASWRTDPAWSELLHVTSLGALGDDDANALLDARRVPAAARTRLRALAHGNPLALSLVGDLVAEGANVDVASTLPADLVATLLACLVRDVPDDRHRRALEVAAVARVTSEDLLRSAAVDEDETSTALFAWLRRLSFVSSGPDGIFPHDLVRALLLDDLRYRDAARHDEIVAKLRGHQLARVRRATSRGARLAAVRDLLWLGRDRPSTRGFFTWEPAPTDEEEPATPADEAAILRLIEAHEGATAADIARVWLRRAPRAFFVFRARGSREVRAVLCLLELGASDDDGGDPAVAAALRHMAHRPLVDPERAVYLRFWVVAGAYQEVSPVQDRIQTHAVEAWLTTPHIAFSFVATRRPALWAPQFDALGMPASAEAAFTVDGVAHTVFAHDWHEVSPAAWLSGERARPAPPAPAPLSAEELANAVRDALRDFGRPAALAKNPLVRSCLFARRPPGASPAETVRALLREAEAALGEHPRDEKLRRALSATYLRPAPTQEQAAERLGLPFSTYRRHLTTAVARVVAWITEQERAAR